MWVPRSEGEIAAVIANGDLRENNAIDVKLSIGDSAGARLETAKDLASFAINGGALLVGVFENKAERRFELSPQTLAGAAEKIEQIAQNRIDPPLFVRVTDIPSEGNSSHGYLFVEIPPSSNAPHMVGGRYYARGDRTTRRLSDVEVTMLHQSRRREDDYIREILRAEVERDPWADTAGRFSAHLFVVAEPLRAPRGIMTTMVRGTNGPIFQLVADVENRIVDDVRTVTPTPMMVTAWPRRARGIAGTTLPGGGRSRGHGFAENDALDIEFQEDGGIRVFCGRLSASSRDGSGPELLMDSLAVAYAMRTVSWARSIAEKADYRGPWGFGLAATKLRGLVSSTVAREYGTSHSPYDRDEYEEVTTARLQEIEDAPGAVVNRIVGPLVRGTGTSARYASLFG